MKFSQQCVYPDKDLLGWDVMSYTWLPTFGSNFLPSLSDLSWKMVTKVLEESAPFFFKVEQVNFFYPEDKGCTLVTMSQTVQFHIPEGHNLDIHIIHPLLD
jgi:hypothetical protein